MASNRVVIGLVVAVVTGAAASGVAVLSSKKSPLNTRLRASESQELAAVAGRDLPEEGDFRQDKSNRIGQQLIYQASFFLETQGKDDPAPRTVITGNSKLMLSIVAETEQGIEYAASLNEVNITADPERSGSEQFAQQAAESMKVPFALHVTPQGRISGVAFPPEGNEVGAGIMRGLASALQFTRPDGGGKLPNAWRASEVDNIGEYEASYEMSGPDSYSKSVRSYAKLELSKAFPMVQKQQGPSAQLNGSYQLDESGRIKMAKLSQTMSLPNDGGAATIRSTYTLELKGVGRGGKRVAGSERWRVQPISATLEIQKVRTSEKQSREILAGGTWDSLREENRAAIKNGDDKARLQVGRRLTALFDLEPQRAREAAIALRNVRDSKEAQTILGALAGAQVPEALAAIQTVATDAQGNPEVRESAIGHLGLHNEPTVDTLKTLEKLAETETNVALKKQAITSMGDVAGKIAANGRSTPDDAALAQRSIDRLTEQLKSSNEPETQSLYLQALGNAGGSQILSSTAALLQSPDMGVRQSAIYALRNVSGDVPDKLLMTALLREEDPTLRGTAAQAASFRKLSSTLLAGVTESLRTDPQAGVRGSAVDCLAALLPQSPSEIRQLLKVVSTQDPDAQVRESAERILKGTEGA